MPRFSSNGKLFKTSILLCIDATIRLSGFNGSFKHKESSRILTPHSVIDEFMDSVNWKRLEFKVIEEEDYRYMRWVSKWTYSSEMNPQLEFRSVTLDEIRELIRDERTSS